MKTTIRGTIFTATCLLLAFSATAQINLNFNDASANVEGAIRLSWNSTSNEVYRIEYANELMDTNTGFITWQTLYDNYPSHGTNTFWLDTGDYFKTPSIVHPSRSPMRFYRIYNKGTNDGDSPYVVITSPTNNAVLSDKVTVSVVATSSMPVLSIRLYVDGQEMDASENGTNFVINTCEWPNGPHILFATANAQSTLAGPSGSFPITIGRAVSPYKTVTFDNLITRVAFSEQFFEPSLGQTQQVSAVFAANVDWTLEIVNEETNAVRIVTGSGTSLKFNWDGTGQGGTNIADGVYYYNITAVTNGMSSLMSGGEEESESLFANMILTEEGESLPVTAKQAIALGMDHYYLKMPPLPKVTVDGKWVSWEEVYGPQPLREIKVPQSLLTSPFGMNSFGGGGSQSSYAAASQSTTAPTRPQTAPVNNVGSANNQSNTYAIAYFTYDPPTTRNVPRNGLPNPGSSAVHLDGCGNCSQNTSDNIPYADALAINMIQKMSRLGWKGGELHDAFLSVGTLRRGDQNGGDYFTKATIGLFMAHGSYGMEPDYTTGSSGSKQIYFASGNPSDGTGNTSWLRLCQFGFGGNLKWMALLACNSLCDPNFEDMVDSGAIPLKETHLVCGTASIVGLAENIGAYWADNMIKKKQPIKTAWFNAGFQQYHDPLTTQITNTYIYRVAGYPECMNDTIATNTPPSSPSSTPGNLTKQDSQVYP